MSREFLSYFTFDNKKCICEIEKIADNNKNCLIDKLAIKKIENEQIPMAYFYGEGLKLANKENTSKNNILGEFLGIKKDDLKTYKSFFEKYGFLFNIENCHFNTITVSEINGLKDNLLAFVYLLNNQFDNYLYYKQDNIKKLLDAILYLLFRNDYELTMDEKTVFNLEKNKIMKIIDNARFHNESSYNKKQKIVDGQIIEYFEIKDCLLDNCYNDINVEDFNNYIDGDYPQWFINLCRVYKNKNQLIENSKYHIIIDFLFHLTTEHSMFLPNNISLDGTFKEELYNEINKDSKLLKALIKISKLILEYEFRNNLSKVTPTFNVEEMKPDWKLPSLYSALYFSLFYMNSKEENLRKCANPNCGQYFQVSKTNSIKKYCSILCTNSVSQRKYQKKQALKKK